MRLHAVVFLFKNQIKQARCFSDVLSREHQGSAFSCCQFGNKVNTHWACALPSSPSPTPLNSPRLSLSLLPHGFHRMAQSTWECSMRNKCPGALMESNQSRIQRGAQYQALHPVTHTQHTHLTHKMGAQVFDTYALGISLCPFPLFLFTHSLHFPLSFSANFWLTRHGHKAASYVHKSGWDSSPRTGMWGWVAFISLTFSIQD